MNGTTDQPRLSGIRLLAQTLGISIGTVSRGLNNRAGVSPHTKARILEEARRLGYVANPAARALKDRPVLNIGLIFAPFFGPHHEINPAALMLQQLLRQKAESRGASLQTTFFTSDADLEKQVESNHLDVVILFGQFSPAAFDIIHETGIPAIILGYHSRYANHISICTDMESVAESMLQYLAALGHEKIGLVTGPRQDLHTVNFVKGFRKTVDEFALEHRPEWGFELPAEKANKFGSAEALGGLLRQSHRPTAIAFSSDWMALGGILAAKEANLSLPRDLSLIGFQNIAAAAEVDPPLTTFDLNYAKLAELVIDLAVKPGRNDSAGRAAGSNGGHAAPPNEILITAAFIKRRSCACLRKAAR